eukprot:GHVT01104860.1.p1 GENE.GHVT01104860.1~~GHVT01104860.1.p1  ORF type:complete len:360 (+),score=56.61 GHVT01104860.1:286-1365(+)
MSLCTFFNRLAELGRGRCPNMKDACMPSCFSSSQSRCNDLGDFCACEPSSSSIRRLISANESGTLHMNRVKYLLPCGHGRRMVASSALPCFGIRPVPEGAISSSLCSFCGFEVTVNDVPLFDVVRKYLAVPLNAGEKIATSLRAHSATRTAAKSLLNTGKQTPAEEPIPKVVQAEKKRKSQLEVLYDAYVSECSVPSLKGNGVTEKEMATILRKLGYSPSLAEVLDAAMRCGATRLPETASLTPPEPVEIPGIREEDGKSFFAMNFQVVRDVEKWFTLIPEETDADVDALVSALAHWDLARSGHLSITQLKNILRTYGEVFSDKEIEDTCKHVVGRGTVTINIRNFVKQILKNSKSPTA